MVAFLLLEAFIMRNKHIICWSAILLLDAIFCYFVIVQGIDDLYRENSWAENLQVLILGIACVIFAKTAYQETGREQVLSSFLAMLCFIFIFREVDFDKIDGMPKFVVFMLAEDGRTFFWAITLGLLANLLRDIKHYLRHFKLYISSASIVYLFLLAPFMLIFSHLFDRQIWMVEHRVFFEELAEMTAYCFMLCSAIFSAESLHNLKQKTQQAAV